MNTIGSPFEMLEPIRSTTVRSTSRTAISWLARLLLGLGLSICLSAPNAWAQQAAAEDGEAVEEEAAEQPILDLGMIRLKGTATREARNDQVEFPASSGPER